VPREGGARKQPNDDIGVWVDRTEWNSLVAQRDEQQTHSSHHGSNSGSRPHSAAIDPLIEIYFDQIHPILPLLDEDEFRQSHAEGQVAGTLVLAMCLVAAKDIDAAPYLRLAGSAKSISPRHFCSSVYLSINDSSHTLNQLSKHTQIQTLALLSMHVEGLDGAEEASLSLAKAIHHAQTIGLHLAPNSNDLSMKRLFWCLWSLDRLNAAINGRPIIMADFDIAIETFAPRQSGFPGFEIWLRVAEFLNSILAFYRPTRDVSSTGLEADCPGLEEMIDEAGGWGLSAPVLATLHLFYLSVCVLSHRTRGFKEIRRSISSNIRQRLCAIEIIRLLDSEDSSAIHPLPILPYAVSLALAVSYQVLRQSHLDHQQFDAREDFQTCCRLLREMRSTWCSADVMAMLGQRVSDQIDQAVNLASFRIPRSYGQQRGEPTSDIMMPNNTTLASPQPVTPTTNSRRELSRLAEPDPALQYPGPPLNDASQVDAHDHDLFDNMDDVFSTFMDLNFPLNLNDLSFADDFRPFD